MTFRIGFRVEGDASTAKTALDDTARGMGKVGDEAERKGRKVKQSADEDAKAVQKAKNVTEQLQHEAMQLRRNSEQQAVHNALRQAGVSILSVEGQGIARMAAANENLRQAKERAARASLKNNESIEKLSGIANIAGGQVGGLVAQAGRLFVGTSRLGPVIAGVTLGLGLLVLGTYKAVSAYAALEAQQAKTANVLRATGNASGQTLETLARSEAALARVGTQTREDIRGAQTELLRYREVGVDTFERTLSAAQKLANMGFVPLKEAAGAFGQAARDPVEGLGNLEAAGLKFSAAQKDVIKQLAESGEHTKAFTDVLRIAETQIGDANVKSADSLTAAFGRLKNGIQSDFEFIGGGIAKLLHLRQALDAVSGAADRARLSTDPSRSGLARDAGLDDIGREPAPTPAVPQRNGGLSDQQRGQIDKVTIALRDQTIAARLNETAQLQLAARKEANVNIEDRSNAALTEAADRVNRLTAALAAERFLQQSRAQFISQSSGLRVEAQTLEASAGAAAAYRYEQEKLADAKARGITLGDQAIAQIKREAAAIGDLTQSTATLRLEKELAFERAQLGRGETEARIARELRASGVDANSADGKRLGDIIRVNEALRVSKDLVTDFGSSFARDFRQEIGEGVKTIDALKNAGLRAFNSLADKLIDIASKDLISKAFGGSGGGGGIFAAILGALGGGGASVADPTFGGFSMAGSSAAAVKFDRGGFTGDIDPRRVAGVVHGREFVVTAAKTREFRPLLDAIHSGRVRGYQGGGFVGGPSFIPSPPIAPAAAAGGAPIVKVYPAAPGETFEARVDSAGQLELVGRMVDERLDAFSRRALPTRVHDIISDPRGR